MWVLCELSRAFKADFFSVLLKFIKHILTKNMNLMIIKNLKGEYHCENGREYFKLNDTAIPINLLSSGQQEALWIFNQLYLHMLRKDKVFLIVEEPEAHLYPSLQKEIVDFIALFANVTGSSAFITTHSPYVLTATNNLYYAGRLHQDKPEDVEKIMGKHKMIAPGSLTALKLSLESSPQNLIDEDEDLMPELIDDISNEINQAYTQLFYLEESDG